MYDGATLVQAIESTTIDELSLQGLIEMCDEYLSDLAGFTADEDTIPWQV